MLLRRVIEHVKTQNWTAVALDFVIVVVGVFIGIQVSNWNADRSLEKQKTAAVGRLHAESEAIVRFFQYAVGSFDARNAARREALERLQSGDFEGTDLSRLQNALGSVAIAPSATPPRSVYDELISTGLFAETGDPAMRTAIADYYSALDFLAGQIDYVRAHILNDRLGSDFEGIKTVFDPEASRDRRRIYDFGALSKDPVYFAYVLQGHTNQIALTEWWRGALEDAEAMCAEIGRVSRRPCAPLEENPPQ